MTTGRRGAAAFVAAGIFASRLFGLARQWIIARFFGQATDSADALNAAFRIPNLLQNLFGEGALSASLIPEYARLRAVGQEDEARRLAGAVAGLLAALVTVIVALGVLATPAVVGVLVGGFDETRRRLAVTLVRIMFPGVGLLVLSAWCLAILNTHRRFFLSYAAPVGWNLAIIGATLLGATRGAAGADLVVWTAWGAAVGGLVQVGVQLPLTRRLLGGIRWSFGRGQAAVRTVVRNFLPALVSRGVVQVSAFADGIIASWLPIGSLTALTNSQLLYTLPVSLFGMSVAAAELPSLAETAAREAPEARNAALRERLEQAARQVAFFVIPSAVAFFALGKVVAGVVLQSGRFTAADSVWVWGTLAGSSVGLLAATLGRLYNSAYFALGDTRTPLRFALVRVTLTIGLGVAAAFAGPALLGIDPKWGTAGLSASAGVAGWVEFLLLQRGLTARIGPVPVDWPFLARLWAAALGAAAGAWIVLVRLPDTWPARVAVLGVYGVLYLGATVALGIPMVRSLLARGRSR
ncbi:MAG: murein biosynthesis integral membrane protein MurJ [Gemmatimonadales bacterium]